MGIRLVLLLVVGLGALYTIHLLAQDFMKIRKGATTGEEVEFPYSCRYNFKGVKFNYAIIQLLSSCWENVISTI